MTKNELNKKMHNKCLLDKYILCKKCKHHKIKRVPLTEIDKEHLINLNDDELKVPYGYSIDIYKNTNSCEIYPDCYSEKMMKTDVESLLYERDISICPHFSFNEDEHKFINNEIQILQKQIDDYNILLNISSYVKEND